MAKRIKRSLLDTGAGLHIREKEDGEESRRICGRAIVFDTPSVVLYGDESREIREVIAREAIDKALLDASDIKMTMFHDRQLILARSNKGKGTLSYEVREDGVYFEFEAPETADGDKAIELVRRGDLAGCSFAFYADYSDRSKVERSSETVDGKDLVTYTVRHVEAVIDFTLAADPAYEETSVKALRELDSDETDAIAREEERKARAEAQIREMRRMASW